MAFFKKRESFVQNIAFMGLMAAIDMVLAVMANILPISALFIMIVMPLTSAVVALFCKTRYFPIYAIATIGLCIAVSAGNFQTTLFYIIPSVFTGFLYGLLTRFGIPASINVFLTGLLQMGLTYLSVPLIYLIYGIDMIALGQTLFGLAGSASFSIIVPTLFFAYGLAQTALSHIFASEELSRLEVILPNDESLAPYYPAMAVFFAALALTLAFFYVPLAYFFLACLVYFTVFACKSLFSSVSLYVYVGGGVFFALTIFAFALLYSLMPGSSGLILLSLPCLAIDFSSAANTLLLRRAKHKTILSAPGKQP